MTALIATITEKGVLAPTYAEVLFELQKRFRAIYGQDINLDNDTADGQWLGIVASAISDANAALTASYTGYAPSTASGTALSSIVRTNGISRNRASFSSVDLRCIGQAGSAISEGVVEDENGNRWKLPEMVVIPPKGEITVTAICTKEGAIEALPDTVTKIMTPTLGWQTVTNPAAAAVGQAVETDAQLRARQKQSVALPSRSVFEGILASVAAIDGVSAISGIDNDAAKTDANGIPPHSIAIIADGGDTQAIADAIFRKKGPGTGTFGNTTQTVFDRYDVAHRISFSRPVRKAIDIRVTIVPLSGYETVIGERIRNTVAGFVDGLAIGESLMLTRLYLPASLNGSADLATYKLVSVETSTDGENFGMDDIAIRFNERAACDPDSVVLVIQS